MCTCMFPFAFRISVMTILALEGITCVKWVSPKNATDVYVAKGTKVTTVKKVRTFNNYSSRLGKYPGTISPRLIE